MITWTYEVGGNTEVAGITRYIGWWDGAAYNSDIDNDKTEHLPKQAFGNCGDVINFIENKFISYGGTFNPEGKGVKEEFRQNCLDFVWMPSPNTNQAEYYYEQYSGKGLTYKTNISDVCKRNAEGNLELTEGIDDNQLLLVESTKENFSNKSVINAIDTQFKYYKFPANIKGSELDFDMAAVNFDLTGPEVPTQDPAELVNAHQIIPYLPPLRGWDRERRRMCTYSPSRWYTNAPYGSGEENYGYRTMPFEVALTGPQQSIPGTYTITPEILKICRTWPYPNIRFRIKIVCQAAYDSKGDHWDQGNETFFFMTLRKRQKDWHGGTGYTWLPGTTKPGEHDQYGNYKPSGDWVKSPSGQFNWNNTYKPAVVISDKRLGEYPSMTMEYIIHPRDLWEWDSWYIACKATREAWYIAGACYFDVELIDPIHPGYSGISGPVQARHQAKPRDESADYPNQFDRYAMEPHTYIPLKKYGDGEGLPDLSKKIEYTEGSYSRGNQLPGYGMQAGMGSRMEGSTFYYPWTHVKEYTNDKGVTEAYRRRVNIYQEGDESGLYRENSWSYPWIHVNGIPD